MRGAGDRGWWPSPVVVGGTPAAGSVREPVFLLCAMPIPTPPSPHSTPPPQPLDALGTVLEGGLLGASDTGYLGARTAASCGVSLLVLGTTWLVHGSLLGVWIGMKAINATALALDLAKFSGQGGKQRPAAGPDAAAGAAASVAPPVPPPVPKRRE